MLRSPVEGGGGFAAAGAYRALPGARQLRAPARPGGGGACRGRRGRAAARPADRGARRPGDRAHLVAGKAAAARRAGAAEVFLYSEPWVAAILAATGGRGADVVFDSVGGKTLPSSFAADRTGGALVFYGMAGGDPDPVDPRMLMDTSKTLTGGDLSNVVTSAETRRGRAAELFAEIRRGRLAVEIGGRFPLAEGAEAHRLLESRQSSGKILLIP